MVTLNSDADAYQESKEHLQDLISVAVQERAQELASALVGQIAIAIEHRLGANLRSEVCPLDATPVEALPLSTRVVRGLLRADVRTFGELSRLSEEELLTWRRFGVGSIAEVRRLLAWHGRILYPQRRGAAVSDMA